MNAGKKFLGSSAPVWMVMGMAAIMTLVVVVLAVFNYNREVHYMEKVLGEKGEALIRSFEAGARAGMMGEYGAEDRLQALIDATAELPDIRSIVLTDRQGRILAHSDSSRIGNVYLAEDQLEALAPAQNAQWVIMNDETSAGSFVVYKEFVSLSSDDSRMMRNMMQHHMMRGLGNGGMMGGQGRHGGWGRFRQGASDPDTIIDKPLIFIGLDMEPFAQARAADIRTLVITSAVLLIVGLGCMLSLFWVQAYRKSRRQLRDTQALASEIISNLPVGLVVTGADGRVTLVNRDAASLLALDSESTVGQAADSVLPTDVVALVGESRKAGAPVSRELLVRTGDRDFPANVSAAPVITDENQHLGNIFILSDLTEIHRLQADVKQREKMAAIGNLAAGVAHEVRNPLSSIKGYATYFAGLFDEGSENRKAANVMVAETDRLNRVISELLEFSRPSDFKFREADVAVIMDTVSRLLHQDAETENIAVEVDVDATLPHVELDSDRMVQALLNIGINGIQAMEPEGRLSLRARQADSGLIIEIEDSGQGIPEKDMTTIFDPYFTTKNQGTGLGLAVVRKIVEGHGGTLNVTSTVGKGTVFTISMPMHP